MTIFNPRGDNRAYRNFMDVPKACLCCSEKWIPKFITFILLLLTVLGLLLIFQPFQTEINVLLINTEDRPKYVTRKEFLSVALDSSLIAEEFYGFNLSDPFLQNLVKPLGGSFLRIGGTMADCLTFYPNNSLKQKIFFTEQDGDACAYEGTNCFSLERLNFSMSGYEWLQINKFAKNAGFQILFDLNSLKRNKDGSWDYSNAEELIKFSAENKLELHWELGNEPNSYLHVFNKTVNGTQLGNDFITLNQILLKYPIYRKSLLVGPDITKPNPFNAKIKKYLMNFLDSSKGVIDAVTWHQYYFNGRDVTLYGYLSSEIFNLLEMEIDTVKEIVAESGFWTMPIWLGETADAYGGGSKDLSDKFISTFIWLDKLGLAAKKGIEVVVRQTLFKGSYGLINEKYYPTPNWWVSVLYKKLVGRKVVECFTAAPPEIRLYCHCNVDSFNKIPSITVFGVNMKNSEAHIRIQEFKTDKPEFYSIKAYILGTHLTIVSKSIYLNNVRLSVDEFGNLPNIQGKNLTTKDLYMPAFSLGFWVIQSHDFEVCK